MGTFWPTSGRISPNGRKATHNRMTAAKWSHKLIITHESGFQPNKRWNLGFTADLQLRFMVIITYQLHIITIVGWACQLKTRWHHLIGSEVSTIGVLHFVHFICWNFWGSRNQQPRPGIVPSDYPWYWVAFGWISDLKLDVLAALGRFATPIRSNVTWSSQPLRPLGSLDFFWVKVEVFQEDLKARRMRGTMFEQRVRTWSCFCCFNPSWSCSFTG